MLPASSGSYWRFGLSEEDVYVISSQIGVVVDGLLFILWAMVCVIGM